MSYKNIFRYKMFLFIILLGLLFLFTHFSYAQYNTSLYRGYLSDPYGGYSGSYGIYDGLNGFLIPSPLIAGLGSIYSELGAGGGTTGLGILNPYLKMGGLNAIYMHLGGFEVMNNGVLGVWSPNNMTYGTSGIYSNMYGLQIIGSLRGGGGLGSTALGNLGGFGSSTEILSSPGLGSLAGLVSLGSQAGLITSTETELTSLGF